MNKKQISDIIGVDQNTLKNWERSRPTLHRIVMNHFNKPIDHNQSITSPTIDGKVEYRQKLSERIGVCERTLYNWEKEKPGLIDLINRGLASEGDINKDLITRLSEVTGKPKSTLYDWRDSEKNGQLFSVLEEYLLLKENDSFCGLIAKLPKWKQKKYYHLIMAEIEEEFKDD
ncbi:hypothetical protein [Sulfuricurvum sp.]|uniref:hypothetical protein n=1 Tax=Sulfuricurvum sp. TaxID=2025608 RepID=UPI0026117B91|nr:hypothetical protein [Sulfuricurvum sp.]MDD3596990.1 hypothetical protein [Sulfuricurvum sp.]